jgi:hypothetical protein
VKLTVISKRRREATKAILSAGDFLGECIAVIHPHAWPSPQRSRRLRYSGLTAKNGASARDQKEFSEIFVSRVVNLASRAKPSSIRIGFQFPEYRSILLEVNFRMTGNPGVIPARKISSGEV